MTFEDLYTGEFRRVTGLLMALGATHQDAEEIAQDAFAKLLVRWHKVSRYDSPGSWVRHVAVRDWASRRRQRASRSRIDAEMRPLVEHQVEEAPIGSVDLDRAIDCLPLGQRQVVILHYSLDMPLREISVVLRVPIGTVQSRLARARQVLATTLGNEEIRHA